MKIALVILHDDVARGGAERYTRQLFDSLQARGHQPTIVAGSSKTPESATVVGASGSTRSGQYRSFIEGVRKHLSANQYDHVHAMLPLPPGLATIYHPHAGVATAEQPRYTGKRLSWLMNPRRRLFAKLERQMLSADPPPVTLTLSQYVEDQLRRDHPDAPAKRLFNGVDIDRFAPDGDRLSRKELGVAEGDTVMLFVGNDPVRKGLTQAIGLIWNFERLHLVVAGRFDHERGEKAFEDKPPYNQRISWLGPRDDVPSLYRSADFLVQLTRHDPCSLATLEALACGLPVLSTRTNGATEVMTSGTHGQIVTAQSARQEIEAAVNAMLAPGFLDTARQACLALRPQLSWETHVDRLIEIYDESSQDRPRAG